jgi:hypothetical protein
MYSLARFCSKNRALIILWLIISLIAIILNHDTRPFILYGGYLEWKIGNWTQKERTSDDGRHLESTGENFISILSG